MKTASRWQQVPVKKWLIANLLNDWFIQEQNSCCSEMHIEMIFVGEIEQKHSILCLKRKCINIKFFFIELLYKISITFVIMLLFGGKKCQSSRDTDIWNINIYISAPISWILWSFLI